MLAMMDVGEVRDELVELGKEGFSKRYGKLFLVLTEPDDQDQFAEFVNTATRDANDIAGGKRLDGVDIRPLQPAAGANQISVGRDDTDIRIKHGKVSKLHAVFTLSGAVDIEIGDGTVRRLGSGDILIAEDVTGQGHKSKAIEGKIRHCIFVPID